MGLFNRKSKEAEPAAPAPAAAPAAAPAPAAGDTVKVFVIQYTDYPFEFYIDGVDYGAARENHQYTLFEVPKGNHELKIVNLGLKKEAFNENILFDCDKQVALKMMVLKYKITVEDGKFTEKQERHAFPPYFSKSRK